MSQLTYQSAVEFIRTWSIDSQNPPSDSWRGPELVGGSVEESHATARAGRRRVTIACTRRPAGLVSQMESQLTGPGDAGRYVVMDDLPRFLMFRLKCLEWLRRLVLPEGRKFGLRVRKGCFRILSTLLGFPMPKPGPVIHDGDFGDSRFNGIDAWDTSRLIQTPHSKSTCLAGHIWLYDDEPSQTQRDVFQRIVDNYESVGPRAAAKLLSLHPDLTSIAQVESHVSDIVGVHIGEDGEDSVQLAYAFDLPGEDIRGFFLTVNGLDVVEGFVAE